MSNLPPDHILSNHRIRRPEMWVQEAIFGHRFIEEQKPFMLVLEVLSICWSPQVGRNGKARDDIRIFSHPEYRDDRHEEIIIPVLKRPQLRYLLFQENLLEEIAHTDGLTDKQKLEKWLDNLNKGYMAKTNKRDGFRYIQQRNLGTFKDLRLAVKILRSLEIDAHNARRWTSKFLVPRGPSLQLPDMDTHFSSDRRFFGRGGEMVYLMLKRSVHAENLGDLIRKNFFSDYDRMNQLAKLVSPDTDEYVAGGVIGYLPLSHYGAYDRIAEDWVSVLKLGLLPTPQKFDPLFRLTALNLVRYFVERAHDVLGSLSNERHEPIPLDATGGALYDLRSLSRKYYMRIRDTISGAVRYYIKNSLEQNPKWEQAGQHHDRNSRQDLAKTAIKESFHTEILDKPGLGSRKPEEWLSYFTAKATSRSRNNISTLIEPLGKNSGFITARPGAGTWFDSSDEFLEALVLAVITKPITIGEFCEKLYKRYGIVIGPQEAKTAFPSSTFDINLFQENIRTFELRLTGLGYVKRLSDDCAFVSNPYSTE